MRKHEEMELSTNVHTFTQGELIHGIGPPDGDNSSPRRKAPSPASGPDPDSASDPAPAPALGPRPGPRPGSRPGPRPCVSLKRLLSQPQKGAQRGGRKRCLTTPGPGTEPVVETSPVLNT